MGKVKSEKSKVKKGFHAKGAIANSQWPGTVFWKVKSEI